MNHMEQYLSAVLAHIRSLELHPEIRAELEAHIQDRAAEHEAAGMAPAEALQLAQEQMGDPEALGAELNRAHRPRTEWWLLAVTGLLVGLGLVAMLALRLGEGSPDYIFGRQVLTTFVGLALAVALYRFDYRRLVPFAPFLYGLTLLGTPVVAFFTQWRAGTHLFITATPVLYCVALAGIFARWRWDWAGARWLTGFLFAAPLLSYTTVPSTFPALAYVAIFLVLMWAAGAKRSQLLPVGAIVALAGSGWALHIMTRPYLLNRLTALLKPWSDPMGAGYQTVQSVTAIQSAGLWGHGIFSAPDWVPEVHTEFVFTYLVHALGWVGGAVICALVALLIARLLRITHQVRDRFGALLATGVVALFGLHFAWNLLMVVGLAPTMGVSLPFISFGWYNAVLIAMIGLVAGVFRRKDMMPGAA